MNRVTRHLLRYSNAATGSWILILAFSLCALAATAAPLPEAKLDGFYDRWLDGVSAWILDAEREAFEQLSDDIAREIFIRRFWEARTGTLPDEPESPFEGFRRNRQLARWQLNFEEAIHRFDDLQDERAQALLMAGKPAHVVVFPGCRSVVRPLRVWSYEGWKGHASESQGEPREGFHLIFWQSGGPGGDYRLWVPNDGAAPLIFDGPARHRQWSVEEVIDYTLEKGCFRFSRGDASRIATALRAPSGPARLRQIALPPVPDLAWLDALANELETTVLETALPAKLAMEFPGSYQRKTVVRGRITIPANDVAHNPDGLLFDRLTITGDIKLGDRWVDSFRVVHLVAGAPPSIRGKVEPVVDAPADLVLEPLPKFAAPESTPSVRKGPPVPAVEPTIVLDFYRRLRPGSYSLDLRVEDSEGIALLRQTRMLKVPRIELDAQPPAGRRLGLPGLTRSEVGVLTTFPGVEILAPTEQLLLGEVELEVATTGGPIERLELILDGEPVASDQEPPFAVTLDLGTQSRARRLEAVAFDPAGRELARDAMTLHAGPQRFAVRLVAPLPGSGGRDAEVEIDIPEGKRLDRLEIFFNDQRIATLTEPPFTHALPQSVSGDATYVRALATLTSGESMEDLVFIGSADAFDRIDVQIVELYTSVRDRKGRFVTGLTAEDFRVLEDGQPQPIRRFDTVRNLPINVAVAMDVSSSMRRRIGVATRSAQRFFETVLTPKDRASLLTFSDDIRQVVPFTADSEDLRQGVSGFRAWGTTRLYDGIVYAVQSFGGLEGKRALVLLSDGQDVDSDFFFKQVLELVVRSGVAVYPIVLGVNHQALAHLAEASGGRIFQIGGANSLDQIYALIEEELRSQYLLVYEPPVHGRRDLRQVEIEVLREGLGARSIRGYYP